MNFYIDVSENEAGQKEYSVHGLNGDQLEHMERCLKKFDEFGMMDMTRRFAEQRSSIMDAINAALTMRERNAAAEVQSFPTGTEG